MAERWFLKIDGIDGESTDAAHKDEIDVESWSWGVGRERDRGRAPASGGRGKAAFQDIHFVARISKASPKLFLACAAGTHHKGPPLTAFAPRARTRAPTTSSTSSPTSW